MTTDSRIWIKICANTSLEDAKLAADAGANAVGFVFAPSPRRVTVAQASAITPQLAPALEKIGVFVDASLDEISTAVDACGLTGVQLHFDVGSRLPAQLRERFGAGLRIVRAVHFGSGAAEQASMVAAEGNIDAILVDSRTATAVGGTGTTFNWSDARQSLFAPSTPIRLIAAGGLTPENVCEAIAILRPWGVDVATGVEASPGRKDSEKVRRFITNARASVAR